MNYKKIALFFFVFLNIQYQSPLIEKVEKIDTNTRIDALVKSPLQKDERDSTLENFVETYEKHLNQSLIQSGCPGAAIVVVQDTNIIMMKGFGLRSRNSKDSVDIHTLFRIGSLSKGFSAMVAARLQAKGLFHWEDKVAQYIPNFKLKSAQQTKNINIRHLLSHTIGFHSHAYTNLIEMGLSVSQILPELKKVNLIYKEGMGFAYQNVAFSLIEKIGEAVTNGTTFDKLLQQEIFEPLHFEDSSTSYEAIMSRENRCSPHLAVANNSFRPVPITNKYYNSVSSGGINTSISDMSKWLQLLLGNHPEIITKSALDEFFTPIISTSTDRRYFNHWKGMKSSSYALGWRVLDYKDTPLIYHGGYVNGFRGEIALDRAHKIAICALFNADCHFANDFVPDFFEKFKL